MTKTTPGQHYQNCASSTISETGANALSDQHCCKKDVQMQNGQPSKAQNQNDVPDVWHISVYQLFPQLPHRKIR